MTTATTTVHATAFVLATLLTAATFLSANAVARNEYVQAEAVVAAVKAPVVAMKEAVVAGHRA
jgi:hypothetical protein